jgi:peptidoglycan/LPS O-acetylase OafA/YrhL
VLTTRQLPGDSDRGSVAMSRPGEARPSARKMPQLDALRAFAVLAVLFAHFVWHPPFGLSLIPWAAFGVQLFFVLSGFLITGILLDCRKEIELGVSPFWMLRQFYIRRFLRIFPLYYAVVLAGYLIGLRGFHDSLGWNLAYLTNYYIVAIGGWIHEASHLWTLSVEEQFYLVWPWLVLFLPSRWLLPSFVAIALFAPLYRIAAIGWWGQWFSVTPFASLDCFGAGGLLAMAQRRDHAGNPRLRRVLCATGIVCGVPLVVLALASHVPPESVAARLGLMNLAMTLLFIPLISGAADGFAGMLGSLLSRRPLLYVGQISYAIYIFHVPMQWALNSKKALFPSYIPRFPLLVLATIALAAISWHFYEKPINDLKRFFPYRGKAPRRGSVLLKEPC